MPEIADRVPDHVARYCGLLAEQLRLAGVPEPRVRTVVHDVLAHVRATGEDPVEAFGQPAEYAAQWADPPSALGVALRLVGTAVAFAGAWVLVRSLVVGGSWTADVPLGWSDVVTAATMVLMGAFVPWTIGLWLSRRAARHAERAPRVSETAVRAAATFLLVGMLIVLGNGRGPGSGAVGDALLDMPRWVLLLVGLASVALLFTTPSPDRRHLPRSPTDDRSLLTRWRARTTRTPEV